MALNRKSDVECRIRILAGDLIATIGGQPVYQRDFDTGWPDYKIPVTIDDLCRRILAEHQQWELAE